MCWSSLLNTSSPRDILSTSLVKSCINVFAPPIAHLNNCSFTESTFPTLFKTVQVFLLKTLGLDQANPGNHRPISNLGTISKVMERLVMFRLRPHLLSSCNFNALQLAYRIGTRPKLLCCMLLDSFYSTVDDKNQTTVISLDVSAAFDTISHGTLLSDWSSSSALKE